MTDPQAGAVYLELFRGALEEERNRAGRLERRATWVVTISGAALTLLIALRDKSSPSSTVGQAALATSLVMFVIAILLAVLVMWPRNVRAPGTSSLQHILDERWSDHDAWARHTAAQAIHDELVSLRKANGSTWRWILPHACVAFSFALLMIALLFG